ncbi:MAG TPA: hypothetical protein VKY19_17530 [Ktedonosporobacter sp.]|jgi:hypothetical protein|nr:hypothetical protein [Ktedonosporobacter sp.]
MSNNSSIAGCGMNKCFFPLSLIDASEIADSTATLAIPGIAPEAESLRLQVPKSMEFIVHDCPYNSQYERSIEDNSQAHLTAENANNDEIPGMQKVFHVYLSSV